MPRQQPYRATKELPRFDPSASAEAGVRLLKAAKVKFALIGRVAVWTYVPPSRQAYTKDVDFAVSHADMTRVMAASRATGLAVKPLDIGGIAIRQAGEVAVDIVDRHPEYARLFAD